MFSQALVSVVHDCLAQHYNPQGKIAPHRGTLAAVLREVGERLPFLGDIDFFDRKNSGIILEKMEISVPKGSIVRRNIWLGVGSLFGDEEALKKAASNYERHETRAQVIFCILLL